METDLPLLFTGDLERDRLLERFLTGDLDRLLERLLTGDLDLLLGGERNRLTGDLDLRLLGGGGVLRLNLRGERRRGEKFLRRGGRGERARMRGGGGFTGITICTPISWPSTHPPFKYFRAFLALAGSSNSTYA